MSNPLTGQHCGARLLVCVSVFLSLASSGQDQEWRPDEQIFAHMVSVSVDEIESSLFDDVPENERIRYALAVGSVQLFRLGEIEKADKTAELAIVEEFAREPLEKISLLSLRMNVASERSDAKSVIRFGSEAIELFDEAEEVPLPMQAQIFRSVGSSLYRFGRFEESFEIASRFLAVAEARNSIPMMAASCFDQVESLYKLGRSDAAEKAGLRALSLFEQIDDNSGRGDVNKALGNVFFGKGDLKRAEDYQKTAISFYEKVGNSHGIANCNFNIGLMNSNQKDFVEALEFFQSASFYFMESGSPGGAGMVKMEQANVYAKQGLIKEATQLFREAEYLLTKTQSLARLAQLTEYWGAMHLHQNDTEKAKEYYQRTLKFYEEAKDEEEANRLVRRIEKLDQSQN